jgi:hypothetical protein
MKKVTTLFSTVLIALLGMISVQAQTILEEGFRADAIPTGWSQVDMDFRSSAGGYALFDKATSTLTSPSFDLSAETAATLTFYVATFGSGTHGPLTADISIDGGTTWDAQTFDSPTPTASSPYTEATVALDASVVGQSDVMVRFSRPNSAAQLRFRDFLLVGADGKTVLPATEVSTIADLRAGTADGEARYRLTGEAVMSFYDAYQGRRYFSDASGSIYSEDPNGNLDSNADTIGVGVTGLTGVLKLNNAGALITFVLDDSSATKASITSTDNEVTPDVKAITDITTDNTGGLVRINDVSFEETGSFATGKNYTLKDADGNTIIFRTNYYDADYIGSGIPTGTVDIVGVVTGYGSDMQVFSRSSADIIEHAGPVKVTFMVNTSTIPDTLKEDGFVQIRGELKSTLDSAAYGAQSITWDASSTTVATNEGGDYWSTEVSMAPGDSLVYKYWIGLDSENGVAPDGGWEANGSFGGNYLFELPEGTSQDTVVDLAYFNIGNGRGAPFESAQDSVTLYFRVNVGYFVQTGDFDPETGKVGLRGVPEVFQNPGDWSSTAIYLKPEATEAPGDNLFYSTGVKVDQAAADTIGEVSYKFVLENPDGMLWDNVEGNTDGNHFTNVPSQDSTIHWSFFQGTAPTQGQIIDAKLTFNVDVGILEGLGYFNSGLDEVMLRGSFNGFGEEPMDFNGFSNTYEEVNFPISTTVGTTIEYKYYIKWDSTRFDENSSNYLPGIAQGAGWEEPGITAGGNRMYTITDEETQVLETEYFNGVPPQGLITEGNIEGGGNTVHVTFSYDMNPAKSYSDDPFDPDADSVYLFVDTPFFALTNNIVVPGDDGGNFIKQSKEDIEKLRFKDDNGDGIYTLEMQLQLPTLNHIGFRIAYGSALNPESGLLANGGGFAAGRRHYQYIQPILDSEKNITWPATYTFPTLEWKREDLDWETPPDYGLGTSNENELTNVREFKLSQNYPNPFNPSTNINFTLASASKVKLTVYNILGQQVAQLVNGRLTAGLHTVRFDASKLASGMYLYRLEAGTFTKNMKMMLIK